MLGALHLAIYRRDLDGAFNVTAPSPATQGELTTALGRVLHRPAVLRVPGSALRLLVGEMAGSVLTGARVVPARLCALGFRFYQPTLNEALAHALGRPRAR